MTTTLNIDAQFMVKTVFHHLFITYYASIICALWSALSASPPPLAGIKFKLDTDVDSLCHPSVALPLSPSASLSPHRLEDKSACRRISLQSAPPPRPECPHLANITASHFPSFSLSCSLTLSHSLHLSHFPSLSHSLFPSPSFLHTHTWTHSIVNKAGEQGTRGEQGNKGPQSRKVRHWANPPHPETQHCTCTLATFYLDALTVSFEHILSRLLCRCVCVAGPPL